MVDDGNRKANIISLTDSGRACLGEIDRAIDCWIKLITKDFSQEEIELGKKLIVRMAANACGNLGDDYLAKLITGH